MPLREDFFDNPTFRATPAKCLNDPFETDIQQYQLENIMNHWIEGGDRYSYKDEKRILAGDRSSEIEYEKKRFEDEVERFGVVSFTEDYTNLLMWAHYANEHKGIVVEISNEVSWLTNTVYSDQFRSGLYRFERGYEKEVYELPLHVIYRDDRPLFESPSDVADSFDKRIIQSFLLSKGNNWIYEKEHRSVLPLEDADIIITTYTKELIEEIGNSKYVEVSKKLENFEPPILNERCYITFNSHNNPNHVIVDSSTQGHFEPEELKNIRGSLYFHYLYKERNSYFFYKIDKRFINGIYFGCKCPKDTVKNIVNKIRNEDVFNQDIMLKQAVISKQRYALDFINL